MIAADVRAELQREAEEAERRLNEYRNGLAPRPDRKHVPTDAERNRWAAETATFMKLLADYRAKAHRSLHPESQPCGQPREGACNCTWDGHVCNRRTGHAPAHPYPEFNPASVEAGGHCCSCGVSIAVDAPQVRGRWRSASRKESAA